MAQESKNAQRRLKSPKNSQLVNTGSHPAGKNKKVTLKQLNIGNSLPGGEPSSGVTQLNFKNQAQGQFGINSQPNRATQGNFN